MQPHLQPVPSWPLATAASGTLSPAVTDRQQSGVCFRLQLDGFLQLNNFLVCHGIKTWFRSLNFFHLVVQIYFQFIIFTGSCNLIAGWFGKPKRHPELKLMSLSGSVFALLLLVCTVHVVYVDQAAKL